MALNIPHDHCFNRSLLQSGLAHLSMGNWWGSLLYCMSLPESIQILERNALSHAFHRIHRMRVCVCVWCSNSVTQWLLFNFLIQTDVREQQNNHIAYEVLLFHMPYARISRNGCSERVKPNSTTLMKGYFLWSGREGKVGQDFIALAHRVPNALRLVMEVWNFLAVKSQFSIFFFFCFKKVRVKECKGHLCVHVCVQIYLR